MSSGAAGPRGLAIAPDGTHAYVAHYNGGSGKGSVSVLRISTEGQLSRQGEPVLTGSSGAAAIALDAVGYRLCVGPGSITTFAVDAHGGSVQESGLRRARGSPRPNIHPHGAEWGSGERSPRSAGAGVLAGRLRFGARAFFACTFRRSRRATSANTPAGPRH